MTKCSPPCCTKTPTASPTPAASKRPLGRPTSRPRGLPPRLPRHRLDHHRRRPTGQLRRRRNTAARDYADDDTDTSVRAGVVEVELLQAFAGREPGGAD